MEAELTKPVLYGLLVIAGAVVWQIISAISSKIVGAGYITRTEYDQDQEKIDKLKEEIRTQMGTMRGIMLVIATKAQIPIDEIKDLVK